MEHEFLDILGNIWGVDIHYCEDENTVNLILEAMQKAYELGKNE